MNRTQPCFQTTIALAAVLAPAIGAAYGFAQTEKGRTEFVGTETCAACHEDAANALKRSPHLAAVRMKMPDASSAGCESCHGPGKKHAEDPSQPMFAFKDEPAAEKSARCLSCHARRMGAVSSQGVHDRKNVSCDTCHSSGHGAVEGRIPHMLRQTEQELCVKCHGAVGSQMEMPFRHKVAEGVIQCSDCHQPHGKAIRRTSVLSRDRACMHCHTDKQGPFTYKHDTASVTGCMSCHVPHGGTNPQLLTHSVVSNLCLECHSNTTGFHNLSQAVFRNCTVCHTAIHGSHVDRKFLR